MVIAGSGPSPKAQEALSQGSAASAALAAAAGPSPKSSGTLGGKLLLWPPSLCSLVCEWHCTLHTRSRIGHCSP